MESKLTDFLKDGNASDRVAARIEDYDRRYGGTARDGLDERKKDFRWENKSIYREKRNRHRRYRTFHRLSSMGLSH